MYFKGMVRDEFPGMQFFFFDRVSALPVNRMLILPAFVVGYGIL